MKNIVNTTNAPSAIGPYSQAIVSSGTATVYVSGQIPIDPLTGTMPEDISAQTKQSLLNLKAILEAAGSSLEDVLKTTVYLKDMNDFVKMNTVYSEFFTKDYPARAAIEIARLPKDALVEIEAIANIK